MVSCARAGLTPTASAIAPAANSAGRKTRDIILALDCIPSSLKCLLLPAYTLPGIVLDLSRGG
jgi:hypothetical protein